MATATLDTNVLNDTAAEITITTETTFSLYVIALTGNGEKYRVTMEASPDDGTTWVDVGPTLSRPGIISCHCAATKVRAKTVVVQGATSTVTVHVLGSGS